MAPTVTIPQKEYRHLKRLEEVARATPDIEKLLDALEDVDAFGARRLPKRIARARREKTISWMEVKRRLKL